MLATSEKLAIAARLHVLLRRKTGRVTDTEWLAVNTEYATEIIRFARERSAEPGFEDVLEWADRLEKAIVVATPRRRSSEHPSVVAAPERNSGFHNTVWADSGFGDSRLPAGSTGGTDANRYVGRLR